MEHHDRDALDAGAPYAREREKLIPVSCLDAWSLSDGEPDIRGWDVRTVSGRPIGTVSDLLVDGEQGEVVILDIGLAGVSRHAFVPVRVVHIERSTRVVVMDSADLPRAEVASADRTPTGRRSGDLRSIRYPRSDRAVPIERQVDARDASSRSAPAPSLEPGEAERRRHARRRIDRMNTEF